MAWLNYSSVPYLYRRAINITAASPDGYTITKTFTSSTTWTCPTGVTSVIVLVVGGGGGGGKGTTYGGAGGGGGGGIIYNASYAVTGGNSYTVTIGGGGASETNGNDSVFDTLTAKGGGSGGTYSGDAGGSQGSGGGGAGSTSSPGAGGTHTADQGYDGAAGLLSSYRPVGGGGGGGSHNGYQGSENYPGSTNLGGNGGAGADYSATFGAVGGASGVFSGGGGGSSWNGGTGGSGGSGGGGAGCNGDSSTGTVGTANTGGGGGAGGNAGGQGGSGFVVIKYTTSYVPSNYKVPIDIHRGTQTIESGTWTVNSKTYNYRVPFTVHTHDALTATYPLKVIIDTQTLVTGGFFASSTAANAKSCEFTYDSDVSHVMKFWVTEAGSGAPDNFNTGSTIYYIGLPSGLTADTDYTMYMYLDPDQTGASSNYSPSTLFSFFEHFDTDAANLTAFLAAYDGDPNTDWDTDPAALDSCVVTGSVLTLTTITLNTMQGVATTYTASNLRVLYRITTFKVHALANAIAGIFDAAGIGAGSDKDGIYWKSKATAGFDRYVSNNLTSEALANPSVPFLLEISKYGAKYQYRAFRDQPSDIPDTVAQNITGAGFNYLAATDVAHKITLNLYGDESPSLSVDWIAAMPEIEKPPYVEFPDILYAKAGTVFLNSNCQHWPYDIAFTDNDGSTELYYWPDPLTELSRQPGDSIQVSVRVTDDLASNQSIYIYYGHNSITSAHAHCSAANTFEYFDDFAVATAWATSTVYAVGDKVTESSLQYICLIAHTSGTFADDLAAGKWQLFWTTDGGSWSIATTQDPIIHRGYVGNVGGQAGRLWARTPQVVKWADNDYRMVSDPALWEVQGNHWPSPFHLGVSESTSPTGPWTPVHRLFSLGEYQHENTGYWNACTTTKWMLNGSETGDNRAYVLVSTTDGFKLAYSDDFETWTVNPNGPFINGAWVTAKGYSFNPNNVRSFTLVKKSSTYYVFFEAMNVTGTGYAYTTDEPEDWDADSFSEGDEIQTASDLGDGCMVLDGTTWYYFQSFYHGAGATYLSVPHYMTCPDADFPGDATKWTALTDVTYTDPLYAAGGSTSPWVLKDGSTYYLYYSSVPIHNTGDDDTLIKKWNPNWISLATCATINGTYAASNTQPKYKQATTSGWLRSYYTGSSILDTEIICEVNTGKSATDRLVGVMGRYDATNNNGYVAYLDLNANAPTVDLYRYAAASGTRLGSAYTIPTYPIPQYYAGMPWRIKMVLYGTSIKIYYSAWGNPWVLTHNLTDTTYYTAGTVGVATSDAEGYFNNFRVRTLVLTEPVVGQAEEESTLSKSILFFGTNF